MKMFFVLVVLCITVAYLSAQDKNDVNRTTEKTNPASVKSTVKDTVPGTEVLEVDGGETSKELELSADDMQWWRLMAASRSCAKWCLKDAIRTSPFRNLSLYLSHSNASRSHTVSLIKG